MRNGDPSMRIFSLAAIAIVACAHQSANVPEPAAAATTEPAAVATSEPAVPATAESAAPATPPPAALAPIAGPVERRAVQSANAPKAVGPYSHAIQAPAGRVLFLSGQIAVDPARDRLIKGDVVKQTDRAMQNLKAILEAGGASFDDVVKTTIFLTDLADFNKVNETYGRYFQKAPRAIGPYSQAIEASAGSFVFVSGQIPVDPATGQLVQGDIVAQTERVMQNLKAVLAGAGASFDDVVKTNIYLADLNDFTPMNETYGRYFQKSPPARATVQMAALPQGARIEIECVAATGSGARAVAGPGVVQSAQAPKAIGPYSQGIGVSPESFLFVSGQIPIDPATGQPVQGDIGAQTERVMENLKAVLEAGGASFDKVVKTTIFVADMADFAKVNETYGRYFKTAPPARATVQVRGLPRGARVEIDCVAAL